MADSGSTSHVIRFADLPARDVSFSVSLAPEAKSDLIERLDLLDLRKVRFDGIFSPLGKSDWSLRATLCATVVQPCCVTLAPVTTRIEEDLTRRYLASYSLPEDAESEMPEDDTVEPLPATLDLLDVLGEALALALPDFPRAQDAKLEVANFTEPGKAAMTDEDARPFAGLASLKAALEKDKKDE